MGTTMQAMAHKTFGGPDVLEVVELPLPVPAEGEVVVRVVAATVNPTDTMMRAGKQAAAMTELTPPYIPGMEFSGYVHSVGNNESHLSIGQRVMGIVNPRRPQGGALQQYVCVPAVSLIPIADDVDLIDAATVPMNGLTAQMTIEAVNLAPGDTLLVTGGAGAVGGYVIPLAKAAGLIVIADGKNEDTNLLKELGADEVLPRGDALSAALGESHPDGVAGLIDTALIGDEISKHVRDGGTTVALRGTHTINDARLNNVAVSVGSQMTNAAALTSLGQSFDKGVLTTRVAHRLPMTEAAQAHKLVEQGGLRGRVVLIFDSAA